MAATEDDRLLRRGYALIRTRRSTAVALAAVMAAALFVPASDQAYAPEATRVALDSCVPQETFAAEPRDPSQAVLVKYLSRRYLVAAEATERMVGAAYGASRDLGLDPLLVLAVISVESRFNPIAESVMGARGLMQIIPKYHQAKLAQLGGDAALWDPESNIRLGAWILQEYVHRTGTLEAGLQYYNGAFWDGTAQYANKVMAERARLLDVVESAPTLVALQGS